ncbi:bifunctional DnaQ family exonuclease/ATP-dependent helicase [Streptococcus saliviloxodontae]|uniref:3'-5' exonuclease DinG n=1 Tax=Streptococcus saliviloxodontae TaxID=1349416 RepID=A0ABS2PLW4_9STRE|nr:bifunctional DnaQ family exonuclease/ATP-dependent helicase [Streptococcus saliviloxodontae]MBM7636429.1 ATP-dependent DNA helicase DinG [Streptococcus saliviloxodontae]
MTDKVSRKYAVVDLEATGASATARIIQVGIVIIENDRIVKTYQTDINPHQTLSDHIVSLTGITDQQLAKAPEFSQVAKDIYQLIEDCIFVAHNVKFDANLLAEELFMEGFELRTPRIDTVELSQIFYPGFEKYNLGQLAEHLSLELEEAHTAISDAYATAQLFLKLQEKIKALPHQTLRVLSRFADSLLFETRMVIDQALAETETPHDYLEVGDILLKQDQPEREERHFSISFETNMALLGLEPRPQQASFAQSVSQEVGLKPHFIQAQAGLGKTYAYLLSLLSQPDTSQLVVSVPTKLLQDQIMAKEAAAIAEVFQTSCHSLKGPANYIKLDAFQKLLDQVDQNRLINRYKMQILVWLLETDTGDLDEIKQQQRFESFFDYIRHDGELDDKSPFKDCDFWEKTYRKAKFSRLLITNHAYLLTRVEDDPTFLTNRVLVVDEAQKIFPALETFSRSQLNLNQAVLWIEEQLKQSKDLLVTRLLETIQFQLSYLAQRFHHQHQAEVSPELIADLSENVAALYQEGYFYEDLSKICQSRFDQYWIESAISLDKRQTVLQAAQPQLMRLSTLLPETCRTLFVSATLEISPTVSLASLLGYEEYVMTSLPATQSKDQKLWIDASMPSPDKSDQSAYEESLVQRLTVLASFEKPTLVLFTSKQSMLSISDQLDQLEVAHLTQDKNGKATNIKKRFDRGEVNLLLGTGSFWEGVDFIDHDQMILVICRLPFDNPSDYFVQKINQTLVNEQKSPFYDYSLPVMLLRLKQAMGRSSRRDKQESAVLLLDSRAVNRSYSHLIREALGQDEQISVQKFEEIMSEVSHFLI